MRKLSYSYKEAKLFMLRFGKHMRKLPEDERAIELVGLLTPYQIAHFDELDDSEIDEAAWRALVTNITTEAVCSEYMRAIPTLTNSKN